MRGNHFNIKVECLGPNFEITTLLAAKRIATEKRNYLRYLLLPLHGNAEKGLSVRAAVGGTQREPTNSTQNALSGDQRLSIISAHRDLEDEIDAVTIRRTF